MLDKLRLEVLLGAVDKLSAPLRKVQQSSQETSERLHQLNTTAKKLERQQALVQAFDKQRTAATQAAAKLRQAQTQLQALGAAGGTSAAKMAQAQKAVDKATGAYSKQKTKVFELRQQLNQAGITNITQAQARLKASMAATNAQIDAQRRKLEKQAKVEERLANLRQKHGREMARIGMGGAAAAGMYMAGRGVAEKLKAPVTTFMQAETAENDLRVSFMQADGSVDPMFDKLLKKAEELGDYLPGTTADFIEMMTTLRKEGMSAESVVGGLGETAALLGVLLQTGPQEAARKMAKMQDAMRATESEMREVGDLMQRANYLGADMDFMQAAIGNAAPVMDILKVKGAEAMRALAPMSVMMNQAGMEDGASVGNAVRKIHERAMDSKRVQKANALLKDSRAGFKLDFTNGKGEFGGLEQLFENLGKLRQLSTQDRGMVVRALWGDDAETSRVLNNWMEKNIDGYKETADKMAAQADLNTRVAKTLNTLENKADAAGGSFSNLLKTLGASIAPDLKNLLDWLGGVASKMNAWAQENPRLTRALMLGTATIAGLLVVLGGLGIALASVLGPMMIARFMLARFGLSMLAARAGVAGASTGLGRLLPVLARFAPLVLRLLGPVGLLITAGTMLYNNWDGVVGGAKLLWEDLLGFLGRIGQGIAAGFGWLVQAGRSVLNSGVSGWAKTLLNFSPLGLLWRGITAALSALGIEVPTKFATLGSALVDGLIGGITAELGQLKDTVEQLASTAWSSFKEKLGIHSPSRVFMQLGGHISEGAALGIERSQKLAASAALGLAAASMAPMASAGPALASSAGAGAGAGSAAGSSYNITINAPAGADPQAIAAAVRMELDKRERYNRGRVLSQMSDME